MSADTTAEQASTLEVIDMPDDLTSENFGVLRGRLKQKRYMGQQMGITRKEANIAFTPDNWLGSEHQDTPVILIHGWTCESTDWKFQLETLRGLGLPYITVDIRGHGASSFASNTDVTKVDFSLDAVVRDITVLLHLLGIKKAIFMGHSLGGVIVCHVAVTKPEFVHALVLIDPKYDRQKPTTTELVPPPYQRPDCQVAVAELFERFFYTKETPESLKLWHKERTLKCSPDVVRGYVIAANKEWAYKDEVPGFLAGRKAPRLVVCGKANREFEEGMNKFQDDKVVEINAGHWLHQQNADEFNTVLAEWLRNLLAG